MKLYQGQIPFDSKGNLMSYAERWDKPKWKDNFQFVALLRITGVERGRSSAVFHLDNHDKIIKRENQPRQYQMFMSNMMEVIENCVIIEGLIYNSSYLGGGTRNIEGAWPTYAFVKKGANYGLSLVL